MLIGWKDDSVQDTTEKSSEVRDTVEDLNEVPKRENQKIRLSRTESNEPSANNHKNVIVVAVIVLVLLVCAYGLYSIQNNPEISLGDNKENTEQESQVDIENTEEQVPATEIQTTATVTEEFTEENPSAVYDEKGNLISSNGIYDEDGNIISDDEDIIKTGLPNFEKSTNNQTTAVVYSASDFIKDLNGVDVPAVYNVKSRDYVKDFVNYEAKRAIIDDGMEMYWLEVSYNSRRYRVQVPFYVFKDLDKTGICVVELEVLTLEGGEKIISYMQVITDYSNLGK